jgi:simple sugar transport system permease protein
MGRPAAVLKVRFRISEIISTLMLNYVAYYSPVCGPCSVEGPVQQFAADRPVSADADLFDSRLHIGIAIALLLVSTYVLLFKMPIGFRWRAVGSNPNTAGPGINVERQVATAFMFSGALPGWPNPGFDPDRRLKDGTRRFGFTAILVALLGRLNPVCSSPQFSSPCSQWRGGDEYLGQCRLSPPLSRRWLSCSCWEARPGAPQPGVVRCPGIES